MIRKIPYAVLGIAVHLCVTTLTTAQSGDALTHGVTVTPFAYGVHRYEPGYWSTIGLRALNNLDSDEEAALSIFVDPHSRDQFMRKMWVPARAARLTWLPLHVPDRIPGGRRYLDLSALRLRGSGREDVLKQRAYDTMISNFVLALDTSTSKTAIMFAKPLPQADGDIEHIDKSMYNLVAEMKENIDGSRMTLDLGGDFFPPMPIAYDALDQLVICDDRIVDDSVGLHAIRHWLQLGGRAWLPLNRVSLATASALLGDALGCEIVDQTELNRFTISDVSRYPDPAKQEVWEGEQAVEFLRVITDSGDVHCRVDGWPAVFWQRIGNGEVLITTLAPEGFYKSSAERGPAGISDALASVGSRFFQGKNEPPVAIEAAKPLLIEQIGYHVPSRGLAAAILLLNCGLIAAAGWWLARRKQREQLAWVAPLLALAAAGAFGWMGHSQNRQVPVSAASFQFVQLTPENNSADVHSLTAVYSPESRPLLLTAGAGELVVPDVSDLNNVVKRVTFDDSGQARWQGISMKPGTVRFIEHYSPISWESPIRAIGRFGPGGLEGRLLGPDALHVSDAVIVASPCPNVAVSLDDQRSFVARSEDVLSRSQFLSGSLLSDEQRRRKTIFRQFHHASREWGYPNQPTLLAWTDLLPAPLELESHIGLTGSTLLAIPLTIERTPAGGRFTVPATFIRPQLVRDERGVSPAYNSRTGEWVDELTGPMIAKFRFVLPKQVLPCRIDRAHVSISLSAPSRKLRIYGFRDGESVRLHEQLNPNGSYRIPIERADALGMDGQGAIVLSLQISSQQDVEDERRIEAYRQSAWRVQYMRVDVEGQALD